MLCHRTAAVFFIVVNILCVRPYSCSAYCQKRRPKKKPNVCSSVMENLNLLDCRVFLTAVSLFPLGLQRRQEEEYYSRLEAERRRQHDEAERRLLEPDEPGLYRPPLPREYELPSPTPSSNAPPPPPQRNTSYLKTQVLSPDTIYTAKFVAYNDDDEEEEDSNLAGQDKYSSTRKSYGDFPPATLKPQQPSRQPRPVSDGLFLSNSFQSSPVNANSTTAKKSQPLPPPNKPSFIPASSSKGRHHEINRLYRTILVFSTLVL